MRALRFLAPFFVAVGPALSVYTVNRAQVPASEAALVFAAIVALAGAVTAGALALVRGPNRALPGAALALFVLFGCGSLATSLGVTGTWQVFPVLLLCLGVVVVFPFVMKRVPAAAGFLANLVGVLGAGLLVVPVATLTASVAAANGGQGAAPAVTLPAQSGSVVERPDIYWIILDGYARADVLAERYALDNRPFLDGLAARSFRILPQSQSNYWQTQLSLAASLNSTYLDETVLGVGPDSADRRPLLRMISDGAVARYLRGQGYAFVAFSTGYLDHELAGADSYFGGPWAPSQFANALLNLGPLGAFPDVQYGWHRDRTSYAFDHLADAAAIERPKFVFAHILAPHHPFAFDRNGDPLPAKRPFNLGEDMYFAEHPLEAGEYVTGYREQLQYVNTAITRTVDQILARSTRPPIIVIQGDHGPGIEWNKPQPADYKERSSILNAWYAPDLRDDLYDTLSPVNTARVIANHYFGAGLPLLPDETYASTLDKPYRFAQVPAQ